MHTVTARTPGRGQKMGEIRLTNTKAVLLKTLEPLSVHQGTHNNFLRSYVEAGKTSNHHPAVHSNSRVSHITHPLDHKLYEDRNWVVLFEN